MQAEKQQWKDELKMGQITITNRVCMAALTRQRCDPKDGIPTDLVAQYYSQRAGCGILLTQATNWSPRGHAFPGATGLHNQQQVEGWKKVINEVHKKEGKIFVQIFHGGRATHEKINGGLQIWGPSAIAVRQPIRTLPGQNYQVPKEMTIQDIEITKNEFRKSMILSRECGFDGVQIHGAHGYLVDSFIRSETNKRTDQYGGSPENRCRFALQLFDIASQFYEPYQLGIKISPVSRMRDVLDINPLQTYSYFLKELSKRKIGFVEMRQSCEKLTLKSHYDITPKQQMENVCKTLRPFYNGILIANDSFDPETGIDKIRNGQADMVSFGRLYISNPDLAQRIINNEQVDHNWDMKTFYGSNHGASGYTDYLCFKKGQN